MYVVKEGHLEILKECFTEEHYHCKTKVCCDFVGVFIATNAQSDYPRKSRQCSISLLSHRDLSV